MKKQMVALLTGAMLLMAAGSALAIPLDPNLVRPSVVNPSPGNENSLQTEIDQLFGAGNVSAANDQLKYGLFGVSTPGTSLVNPQLRFEWTAAENTQGMGIFGWDGNAAVKAQFFAGANSGVNNLYAGPKVGDYANIKWTTQTAGYINTFDGLTGALTNNVLFAGINKDSFGFYFEPTAGKAPTFFSVDSLNVDGLGNPIARQDRVLSYSGHRTNGNSGILFAYEDGTDFDYQDAGFFVESINPVPEPGTMVLLGFGMLGLAIYGKRRMNKEA